MKTPEQRAAEIVTDLGIEHALNAVSGGLLPKINCAIALAIREAVEDVLDMAEARAKEFDALSDRHKDMLAIAHTDCLRATAIRDLIEDVRARSQEGR